MFARQAVLGRVAVAVTDRFDGVSTGAYASLNLADHVGDDPAAVAENRRLLTRATSAVAGGPVALAGMRQVHGHDVAVVEGPSGEPPVADALVTTAAGLALTVLVADCTPVLLWDAEAAVVAAVHVGRRGLAAQVLPAALEVMVRQGARPGRLEGLVGPGICAEHYEVPVEMRAEVAAVAPASAAATRDGRPALDIRAGVLAQLHHAGVRSSTLMDGCTVESPAYFSHRRDGTTGRFAGLVWLQP